MQGPLLTRQQSRQVDQLAIEEYGFAGLVLMENAGRGVVDTLERIGIDGPVAILCGKGNNGGDGFVIARHLEIRGHECRVLLLAPADELTGDALANYQILTKCDVPIVELTIDREGALGDALSENALGADWLVDAMLGTGAIGSPRAPYDEAIRWFNEQTAHKLAIDVPSGLDCDKGERGEPTVRADHTCTFVTAKRGYANPAAARFLGQVHVLDIGTPPRLIREISG